MSKWIDISQQLYNGMANWPGDTPFSYECVNTKEQTGSANIGSITTSVHMGTHIDAPFHFDNEGKKVIDLNIETYIGHARVFDLVGCESVGRKELEEFDLEGVQRILLKLTGSPQSNVFPNTIPFLRGDIGSFLKEKGILLVGVDVPSVDPLDSKELEAHHALHENGVMILENIVLENVEPGNYELIALPLPIREADGSPVRAVIKPL